jgi:predicted Fe-Mo cluster-binding NifX family protein
MKVAVSAEGKTLDSPVDQRFGRAAWFVVADTETGQIEAVRNDQNMQAAQGAGVQAGSAVANHGVGAVLTGHCGPKAFRVLAGAGVRVYVGVTGTVGQALEDLKAGRLTQAERADVEGHWA